MKHELERRGDRTGRCRARVGRPPRGACDPAALSSQLSRDAGALVWATGYNVLAIRLAAGAFAFAGLTLAPAVGAVLMSLPTVVVAVNAQFLRRLRLRPGEA